jgi:hypothetical protein
MALNIKGEGGELRIGTRLLARLAGWHKEDKRITFAMAQVNEFAAGLGQPPTEIRIPVSRTVERIYPIVSGNWRDGSVFIDLMAARTETK